MSDHPLDKPALSALTSRHRAFAQGQGGVIRYDPGIVPFAALAGADPAALARAIPQGQVAAFLQSDRLDCPEGFVVAFQEAAVQMLGPSHMAAPEDPRITPLSAADAPDMLALAEATQPGPFTLRALDIGRFCGVRQEGRLIAMAGERMACDGHVEVSGVCVAEEARGQGLARLLSAHVTAAILAGGDRPFLHAVGANTAAITLYRSLGFTLRAPFWISAFLRRA